MGWELSWFWFWVILTVVLVVGEIFTAGFFLLPLGVGAGAAAIAAWFDASLAWQWVFFLVVSIPALLLSKRFADRVTRSGEPLRVAADRAVGEVGLVIEPVRPHGTGGRVRVGREEWRAEPDHGQDIPEGAEVEVLRVDGTHLIVRPRQRSPEGGESEEGGS
jgi:membrane protein implicated in regulation of membrane protease activity